MPLPSSPPDLMKAVQIEKAFSVPSAASASSDMYVAGAEIALRRHGRDHSWRETCQGVKTNDGRKASPWMLVKRVALCRNDGASHLQHVSCPTHHTLHTVSTVIRHGCGAGRLR